jgi:L-alanine-DL-glutamate epimerase-like enolase superfamily enzyme
LGPAFAGRYIADYLRREYAARLPVFHLVGGLDKLREAEIDANDPQDGLPISLDQWIRRDGLFCFKVKLNGRDLAWDLDRIVQVSAVARHTKGDAARLHYSLDTNEQCASPDYVVELLHKLRERSRRTYDEVLYIEQPTGRNLRADAFELREAAALKPVIVDESLIGLNDFYFAMDHGWSGIALKTCKCQSKALLFACLAEQMGIPYTVQDLSNPGIALVQSVGLAARLNPMLGVESNAVQFFPQTSAPESRVHRGIFNRSNGFVDTESIRGHGLGLQVGRLDRTIFEIDR